MSRDKKWLEGKWSISASPKLISGNHSVKNSEAVFVNEIKTLRKQANKILFASINP